MTIPGFTALMQAAQRGQSEIVEILLVAGADVQAEDPNGYTALDYAKPEMRQRSALPAQYRKTIKLLKKASAR